MHKLRRRLGLIPGMPMQGVFTALYGLLALCVLVVAVNLLVGGEQLWGYVAVLCAIGILVVLWIVRLFNAIYVRDLNELLSGGHLAHWTYTPEEWSYFAERDWERAKREARNTLLVFLAIVVGMALVSPFVKQGVSAAEVVPLLAAVFGAGVVISAIIGISGWRRYARRNEPGHTVHIGPAGFYLSGRYTALHGIGFSLIDLSIIGYELVFRIESTTRNGHRQTHEAYVPIPYGCDAEAKEVIERLRPAK